MKTYKWQVVVLAVVILVALAVSVAAAAAAGTQVTRGDFHTYASGPALNYDISGRAQMERLPSGKTIVQVQVKGLKPDVAYPAHVHNKACNDNNGGGHYQHIVAGPVDAVNEIWPGFTTNAAGIGSGKATNGFIARAEAQSVVIHDPTAGGARIACADLQ